MLIAEAMASVNIMKGRNYEAILTLPRCNWYQLFGGSRIMGFARGSELISQYSGIVPSYWRYYYRDLC